MSTSERVSGGTGEMGETRPSSVRVPSARTYALSLSLSLSLCLSLGRPGSRLRVSTWENILLGVGDKGNQRDKTNNDQDQDQDHHEQQSGGAGMGAEPSPG